MRKLKEFFCRRNISDILKKKLNIADFEVRLNDMDEQERLDYVASSARIVEEPAFKENIEKAINAQANLTFQEKGNLHDSKVAIMALRSLQDIFEKQARYFESIKSKKVSNPYDIG